MESLSAPPASHAMEQSRRNAAPPRENLVRAQSGGYELREVGDGQKPVLTGHFAVFNTWTEINSMWEGNFMERLAPGSFKKTFAENGDGMRTTFNHGHDVLGDQVLGRIAELREDDTGAYYEVELFDGIPQLIMDGLAARQYGASFRFRVMREQIVEEPGVSDYNPKGLPERTIKEVAVQEFGPVTWPAYPQATAGLRSLTDKFIFEQFANEPERLRELVEAYSTTEREEAPSEDGADVVTPSEERREDPEPEPTEVATATEERLEPESDESTERGDDSTMDANKTLEELKARREEIVAELQRMDADAGTAVFSADEQAKWDALQDEKRQITAQIVAKERRLAELAEAGPTRAENGFDPPNVIVKPSAADLYDLSDIRMSANPKKDLAERASRVIERTHFADTPQYDKRNQEDLQETVEDLVRKIDDPAGITARRVITAANPVYEKAFWKALTHRELSVDERRALERVEEVRDFERALGVATSGYAMPIAIDPTVLLTSNGAVNPLRAISRVVQISGQTWNGVNSAGVTASFDTEASEVSDDTPTLTQPSVTVLLARAFVPYSIESEGWSDIRNELASEFADAKDVLEAQKFTLGTGTPEPQGFTVGATSLATTAASATIALADLDTLEDSLPVRFQPNAVYLANRKFYSKVRQLARTAGVTDNWPNPGAATPDTIHGVTKYECSDMVGTVSTTGSLIAAYGDFAKGFLIVDRVGMNVEYIQNLVGTNHRPTGQRGLFGYWSTNSVVRSTAPIRLLKIL